MLAVPFIPRASHMTPGNPDHVFGAICRGRIEFDVHMGTSAFGMLLEFAQATLSDLTAAEDEIKRISIIFQVDHSVIAAVYSMVLRAPKTNRAPNRHNVRVVDEIAWAQFAGQHVARI